jgi:hypothetical protein
VVDAWNAPVQVWHGLEVTITGNSLDNGNHKTFNGIGNNGDAYGQIVATGSTAISTSGTWLVNATHNTATRTNAGRAAAKESRVIF